MIFRIKRFVFVVASICEDRGLFLLEASARFEPAMRILQTLALPLGHDAIYTTTRTADWKYFQSATLFVRAGDGIRTHDLLLGKETYYHCTTPAIFGQPSAVSAETQDRTGDTAIFSRVLYQLSYLGESSLSLSVRDFTRTYRDCQENISNNKDAHGFCRVCSTEVILSIMNNQFKVKCVASG